MSAPVPISDNHIGGGRSTGGSGSPIWPRRATKACASCRRDKIRCDGLRPCSACAKKGFAADQCTDGCEPCRRARVRCEDGNDKPCRRCREMMLNCADGPAGPGCHSGSANTTPALMQTGKPSHRILVGPMRSDDKKNTGYDVGAAQHPPNGANGSFSRATAGGSPSPPAASGNNNQGRTRGSERAKLACVGCRRDNKKCDDHRPCSRCVARGEDCIHVSRGPKLVKLRCEGCREDNKRCEESRPCKYCVEDEKECIVVPRKGRGHGTRVKSACVSCRRDKIRCDGDRPCASCVKKGCECIERACLACSREGKGSQCMHRKSADGPLHGTPTFDPATHSDNDIRPPTPIREKEYHFVPSQDDSRWMTFATAAAAVGAQASHMPPSAVYAAHNTATTSPAYYYYPGSGANQSVQLQTSAPPPQHYSVMHNQVYTNQTSSTPSSYFFDVLDPSIGSFHFSQHMASTSSSRTFLPDD